MSDLARLCLIPARGGSKRVPRKNVRPLGGRSILAYTIDAALESGCFESVVVSTDDAEIAAVAVMHGAQVPFRRDASLADDVTPVSAVVVDALTRLDPEGIRYTAVAQMMPNCPLRNAADVRASLEHFERSGAPSQISVVRFGWANPWWALRRDIGGSFVPLFPEALASRSQDLPELFAPTGAIWWARPAALRVSGTFYAPGHACHCLPWISGIDIDTEEDWALTEALAEGRDGCRQTV